MFIETVIGSPPKVKVLRVLAGTQIAYSLYEIKKLTGLSIGVVHKVVTLLLNEGLITKKKGKGKQGFYQINANNSKEIISLFEKEKAGNIMIRNKNKGKRNKRDNLIRKLSKRGIENQQRHRPVGSDKRQL